MSSQVNNFPGAANDRPLAHLYGFLHKIARITREGQQPGKVIPLVFEAIITLVPLDALTILILEENDAGLKNLFYHGDIPGGNKDPLFIPTGKLENAFANEQPFQFDADDSSKHHGEGGSKIFHNLIVPICRIEGRPGFLQASRRERFNLSETDILAIVAVLLSGLFTTWKSTTNDKQHKDLDKENRKLTHIIDLARSIAHELNQPLTGIVGYCALIQESVSRNDAIHQDLDKICKQTARLEDLIYKFQNIAHVEFQTENKMATRH